MVISLHQGLYQGQIPIPIPPQTLPITSSSQNMYQGQYCYVPSCIPPYLVRMYLVMNYNNLVNFEQYYPPYIPCL